MNSMPSKSIKTFFFSGNQIGATIQGGQHLEGLKRSTAFKIMVSQNTLDPKTGKKFFLVLYGFNVKKVSQNYTKTGKF